MAAYPEDLRYTKDHEWARKEGDLLRVGITTHAVEQLGDVTLVDLAPVGSVHDAHARFGDIESVKAVSELFMPIAGTIVERNEALSSTPEKVNADPYGEGWMVLIRPANPADFDALMDAAAYEAYLGTL
jgi:glycine cleavage system H protein